MHKPKKPAPEPATDRAALWRGDETTGAATLADIRAAIDRIDGEIVTLLAQRLRYTRDAARFKASEGEVAALGAARGVPAEIVEPVYRALVAASIEDQRKIFRRIAK